MKTEIRELTCINCPLGCTVTVELHDGEPVKVTGNTCVRGEIYAKKEVTHPTRVVTSTIRVKGGVHPVVAVKTRSDIPKELIFRCMEAINALTVEAPVSIGDVLMKDICDTGVDLVATQNCPKAE